MIRTITRVNWQLLNRHRLRAKINLIPHNPAEPVALSAIIAERSNHFAKSWNQTHPRVRSPTPAAAIFWRHVGIVAPGRDWRRLQLGCQKKPDRSSHRMTWRTRGMRVEYVCCLRGSNWNYLNNLTGDY